MDSSNSEPDGPSGRLRMRPWARKLWMISVAGLLIAASPLAVAFVGLALDNQYLMTYHWLAYFSIPIGLPITLIAGLAATVMTVKDLSKGRAETSQK